MKFLKRILNRPLISELLSTIESIFTNKTASECGGFIEFSIIALIFPKREAWYYLGGMCTEHCGHVSYFGLINHHDPILLYMSTIYKPHSKFPQALPNWVTIPERSPENQRHLDLISFDL